MTYALSWPLQEAVFASLSADAELAGLVGARIYDAPPPFEADEAPDAPFVTLGDERVDDWSTKDGAGAVHLLRIRVTAPRRGFAELKRAAGRISDVLLASGLAPSRGRVVHLGFVGARTRRLRNDLVRQVELRFRAMVEDG